MRREEKKSRPLGIIKLKPIIGKKRSCQVSFAKRMVEREDDNDEEVRNEKEATFIPFSQFSLYKLETMFVAPCLAISSQLLMTSLR